MAEVEYGFFTQHMKMLEANVLDKEKAAREPMWRNAGKTEGLQIWRIQSLRVTSWPRKDYGNFYDGDSYIILKTSNSRSGLQYDLHTWIGKFSTEDEYVMAAHKMIELATYLDDKPVQHREVQARESRLFKSYFKGIKYMHGGAKSVLEGKDQEENRPRLYHVHGQRMRANITEVPLDVKNIDDTDVYILESGSTIYQWNGRGCNNAEKAEAMRFLQKLKADHSGHAVKVEVIDQRDLGNNRDEFFHMLMEYSEMDSQQLTTQSEMEPRAPVQHPGILKENDPLYRKAEIPPVKSSESIKNKETHFASEAKFSEKLLDGEKTVKTATKEQPNQEEASGPIETLDAESAEQILEITKGENLHLVSESEMLTDTKRETYHNVSDSELHNERQAQVEKKKEIPRILTETQLPRRKHQPSEDVSEVQPETQLPRRQVDVNKEDVDEEKQLESKDPEQTPKVNKEDDSLALPEAALRRKLSDCQLSSDIIIVKELYRLSDAEGEMRFTKVKEGDVSMTDFDKMDVFIFDTKETLFVWIGSGTTSAERKNAMTFAHNYLVKTDHPYIPVTCFKEGMESEDFRLALL